MQGVQVSVENRSSQSPRGILQLMQPLFNPQQLLYALIALLLIAAAAASLVGTPDLHTSSSKSQQTLTSGPATDSPAAPAGPTASGSTDATFSQTSTGGNTATDLTVNGQDVSVPEDGTTHETTIDNTGGRTTVSTTSNQSSVSNTSTNHISIHVHSSSSSSGAASQ